MYSSFPDYSLFVFISNSKKECVANIDEFTLFEYLLCIIWSICSAIKLAPATPVDDDVYDKCAG
jgi:hypothetical protein